MEKMLMTVRDVCDYTGWGETKVREIMKSPNGKFTIRMGNRLYADKEKFEQYLDKCARYQLRID